MFSTNHPVLLVLSSAPLSALLHLLVSTHQILCWVSSGLRRLGSVKKTSGSSFSTYRSAIYGGIFNTDHEVHKKIVRAPRSFGLHPEGRRLSLAVRSPDKKIVNTTLARPIRLVHGPGRKRFKDHLDEVWPRYLRHLRSYPRAPTFYFQV